MRRGIRRLTGLIVIWVFVCGMHSSVCSGQDKVLTLAVGMSLPPYNIEEEDRGMELDIVREALRPKGYAVKPKFVPFARVKRELINQTVDGALTITPDCGIVAFYSDPHIVCENVVVSLKKNQFDIQGIDDLKDKGIVAFQDATTYLGEAFADMAKGNPDYREIADQALQINLLFSNRIDAIVLDKNIYHYLCKHNDRMDTTQPVDTWPIFEPSPFRVAFIDRKVRDDFNAGLRQLRQSGRYDEIIQKYISR